jgi:hypothetical protein
VKPDVPRFLDVAAGYLMMQAAPHLAISYQQSTVAMMAVMLLTVGEEFDRAAARRVEENRAMRELFAGAVAVVSDGDLRGRLAAAAASSDPGFTIADLERANAALRALLIELHAHVEDLAGPAARDLEAAIWRELVTSTERRRLSLQAF